MGRVPENAAARHGRLGTRTPRRIHGQRGGPGAGRASRGRRRGAGDRGAEMGADRGGGVGARGTGGGWRVATSGEGRATGGPMGRRTRLRTARGCEDGPPGQRDRAPSGMVAAQDRAGAAGMAKPPGADGGGPGGAPRRDGFRGSAPAGTDDGQKRGDGAEVGREHECGGRRSGPHRGRVEGDGGGTRPGRRQEPRGASGAPVHRGEQGVGVGK